MIFRTGFVSNSSSSSFIVLKVNEKLTKEEALEKLDNSFKDEFGEDYLKDEYVENMFKKISDKLEKSDIPLEVFFQSIEYGAEENVINMLEKLNIEYLFAEDL